MNHLFSYAPRIVTRLNATECSKSIELLYTKAEAVPICGKFWDTQYHLPGKLYRQTYLMTYLDTRIYVNPIKIVLHRNLKIQMDESARCMYLTKGPFAFKYLQDMQRAYNVRKLFRHFLRDMHYDYEYYIYFGDHGSVLRAVLSSMLVQTSEDLLFCLSFQFLFSFLTKFISRIHRKTQILAIQLHNTVITYR